MVAFLSSCNDCLDGWNIVQFCLFSGVSGLAITFEVYFLGQKQQLANNM